MAICECFTWCRDYSFNSSEHHHRNCEKFKTEKYPRLFYYEEAESCYMPAPEKLEHIIDADSLMENEHAEIDFVRKDMTDYEFFNLPEE